MVGEYPAGGASSLQHASVHEEHRVEQWTLVIVVRYWPITHKITHHCYRPVVKAVFGVLVVDDAGVDDDLVKTSLQLSREVESYRYILTNQNSFFIQSTNHNSVFLQFNQLDLSIDIINQSQLSINMIDQWQDRESGPGEERVENCWVVWGGWGEVDPGDSVIRDQRLSIREQWSVSWVCLCQCWCHRSTKVRTLILGQVLYNYVSGGDTRPGSRCWSVWVVSESSLLSSSSSSCALSVARCWRGVRYWPITDQKCNLSDQSQQCISNDLP